MRIPARKLLIAAAVALPIAAAAWWWLRGDTANRPITSPPSPAANALRAPGAPVTVTTAIVKAQDLPVNVSANGAVVSLQSVDVRPQVSSTVAQIHVREGHFVKKGDLLFTLDARTEEANVKRAEAQVVKTRSDVANADRNLKRQRELFEQKFVSQSALDTAINQADILRGQLAVDEAAAESARVARSFTEIRAPFGGRTSAIAVRVGSLVQPQGAALVTISQIDPIGISFALPERELHDVQRALAKGDLKVSIKSASSEAGTPVMGNVVFVESTVDNASGTVAMKASTPNTDRSLWPGMFVNVTLASRTLQGALVVPVQAVQTGPERKFVYVVGEGGKTTLTPISVDVVQDGLAAIQGVAAGTRVVVEGAQNVRKDSVVVEDDPKRRDSKKGGPGKQGKAGGADKKAGEGTAGKSP